MNLNPDNLNARKPYALLPGLTVIFDADGCNGPCVDIEADEFARLFAPQNAAEMDMTERLTRALKRAAIASVAHICDDDGGTSNFDSPVLDYAACGLTRAMAEDAIKSVGLYCYDWKPFRNHRGEDGRMVKAPTYLVISGFQCGQGYRRTRMAEAFCQRLNEDGFEAGMYYQMD